MLRLGIGRLREQGMLDYAQKKWIGKDIGLAASTPASQELMVLKLGQVLMVFFVLTCSIFASLVILCVEHISKRLMADQDSTSTWAQRRYPADVNIEDPRRP